MTEIGAGERSARRILVIDAALLITLVVAVHLALVAKDGQPPFPPWSVALSWFAATVTLVAGLTARWVPDAALRAFAIIAVVAYGLTLVTFPFAVPAEGIDRIPWVLSASGAAAAAALVAGGRTLGWITVCAGSAAGIGYRVIYGGLDLNGIVNDAQALLTGAVIGVIGGHIISVGRGLDAAAATTTIAVARESAERGRLAARSRAATLVHDEVLATLNLAASPLPIPRDLLAAQAAEASSMVTSLVDEQAQEPAMLRVTLAEHAHQHGASFSVRGDPVSVPALSQEALVGATRQALRNSLQHAGARTRTVSLEFTRSAALIEIADDGVGFDPARVADDRLGIRQSIVGRMARIDGGHAEILSAPGRGTVVRLRLAAAPVHDLDTSGDERALRAGLIAIAIVYVLTQTVSALVASIAAPLTAPVNAAMLATALLAAEILRRSPTRRPSAQRTAVVLALTVGGVVAGAAAVPFTYGGVWFAIAFAFVLVSLILRGRIGGALSGGTLIVAALIVIGAVGGASVTDVAQVLVRLVVLVALAAAILVVVQRMQRRIAALHREAVIAAERASWTLAARSEITARVADLGRTVVPLLERIAEGQAATEAQRREYATWEGELRDSLRAGSLAREPLVGIVATARDRGVDVVLLDDSGGSIADELVDPVLSWMADAIAGAERRAVGRLLPPGRGSPASVTVDGRQADFIAGPQGAHGPVSSFQGE
jgi:signal transduction histidine kinase